MATAMTYTSLLNDLRNYLERGATFGTDPSDYIQLPSLVGHDGGGTHLPQAGSLA